MLNQGVCLKNNISSWCAAFPGREAYSKGPDKSFYKQYNEVREIFSEASSFLNKDIAKLCYSGTNIEAKWQIICVVVHCYALYKVYIKYFGSPRFLAGYSQGEFTACIASKAFSLLEILDLICKLEDLLQNNNSANGYMYRIVDLNIELLEECCKQIDNMGRKLCVSSYISDVQNIISGEEVMIKNVIKLIKEKGARWAIDLKSTKAFHSPLCDNAAVKAKIYFDDLSLKKAIIPVYSCYDGSNSKDSFIIRYKLSRQINHPILWGKLIKDLVENDITQIIEFGPGCTVSANSRISDSRIFCKWIGTVSDI